MKRNYSVRIIALVVLGLVVAGCASGPLPYQTQDDPLKRIDEEGVVINLRFINDETLKRLYGKGIINPFIAPMNTLQRTRFLVFELIVRNKREENVTLNLNQMELQFSGRPVQPTNSFQLINSWKQRDEREGIRPIDRAKKEKAIKRYIAPNKIVVSPGSSFQGYLLFKGGFPNFGEVKIYLPPLGPSGRPVHVFEFDYKF
ncbi:MAG: hypothetical protein GH155_02155 [Spirochaeta sp.]|nr:hypothetical protein [Spirochaeta sp.]